MEIILLLKSDGDVEDGIRSLPLAVLY